MSDTPEFSRPVSIRSVTEKPVELVASAAECAALAQRFGLVSVESLAATLALVLEGDEVAATGPMRAAIVQSCSVSGDDLPVQIAEDVAIRFVPAARLEASEEDEEIELTEEDLDVVPYDGTGFDLGEAVAQSLALAIDPFACGPDADNVRREKGLIEEGESGPLAEALRGLRGE
ncbi:YceD family protein [Aurantiacibacter aquimixticola]|uniref:DUF177 domain-containing protein n=1 Tax=Aurantiacibacter aquimixticola TaxID=1958945 RepID=A0A419RVS6_9SPHN|nr:YceD family protein [Aurantiacibacter aquimixticola]RJY09892.1 DUF177 domain-containing protein [Aurantiacibacter aquimixticola]